MYFYTLVSKIYMKLGLRFLVILLVCIGCNSDDENNGIIISDPVGSSIYIINNQSDTVLDITFVTSIELGLETMFVDNDVQTVASIQIFQDSIIGTNPAPENSFSEISFFDATVDDTDAILILDPINNEDWEIIEQTFFDDSNTLALTTYQLTITNEDLN